MALTASPNTANVIGIAFYAGGSSLLGRLLAQSALTPQAFWWVNASLAAATLAAGALMALKVTTEPMVLACP